jgi:hypothetical protein
MAEKVDYSTLSMAELQAEQARLYALAVENGVVVPEEATIDFETIEVGVDICTELANRVNAVTDNQEAAHPAPSKKKPKAKAKAKKKAKATGETAVKTQKKTEEKLPQDPWGRKSVKTKAGANARKAVKGKTSARKNGDGKTATVIKMLRRAKGATRKEILKYLGWPSVSVQQLAKSAGVKLKVVKTERPFHYIVTN